MATVAGGSERLRANARTILLPFSSPGHQSALFIVRIYESRNYWVSKWNWQVSLSANDMSWANARGPATQLPLVSSTWSLLVWALAVSAVLVHLPFVYALLSLWPFISLVDPGPS